MGYELVIVGGGNMGAALLGGLLASGRYPAESIAVVEIVAERRRQLGGAVPRRHHVRVGARVSVRPCWP